MLGTPIYSDVNGDLFGLVTVETDLAETIRAMPVTTVESGVSAYSLDSDGKVLLHYSRDPDFQDASVERDIGELVEAAKPFYASEGQVDHFSEGQEVFGLKVRVDPRHSSEYLGVLLTVEQ